MRMQLKATSPERTKPEERAKTAERTTASERAKGIEGTIMKERPGWLNRWLGRFIPRESQGRIKKEVRYRVDETGVQFFGSPFLEWESLAAMVEEHRQEGIKALEADMKKRQVA